MHGAISNCYTDKRVLIRIYKKFKNNPLKVFTIKDFFGNGNDIRREKYLHTLVSLGIIEEVQAIWLTGRKKGTKRRAIGYKLILHNQK